MTSRTRLVCAMGVEAAALRIGLRRAEVVRTGIGPAKAARRARALAKDWPLGAPVVITGLAGGLRPEVRPGDLVVASEIRRPGGETASLPGGLLMAGALRRAGLSVHVGPMVSVDHLVHGDERSQLAASGALAVDMESAWIHQALGGRPRAVVRAISDTVGSRFAGVLRGGWVGLRSLSTAAAVLGHWEQSCGRRSLELAAPRSFCAGVERAIETVERAIERFGAPVYVRRQIVHNRHVVSRLAQLGAVFVTELDEVPRGAVVVFAAHGVSPAVRLEAADRSLSVIDATCPLVAKVHIEARRFASQGYEVILVGHPGHDEVEGTMGEVPGVHLVQTEADVESIDLDSWAKVAYTTQTTLAVDEVAMVIESIQRRFPGAVGPGGDDVCYATQNRQEALRAIIPDCDFVLVVGSPNSSNGNRLVEVARRQGCPAELIDDASELRLEWLSGVNRIGLTSAASTPDSVVDEVIGALGALGPLEVSEHVAVIEKVRFPLPAEVR